MTPQSLQEWETYIITLSGDALRSKALALNTLSGVRMLEDEGYQPKDIENIFRMFVARFQSDGQEPPSRVTGCYLDYRSLS